MDETAATTSLLDLPAGHLLRVTDGDGLGIAVFDGLVWITQAGDRRDVFLRRGDTFAFDHGGIALVEALSHARVAVCGDGAGSVDTADRQPAGARARTERVEAVTP